MSTLRVTPHENDYLRLTLRDVFKLLIGKTVTVGPLKISVYKDAYPRGMFSSHKT